MSVVTKYQIEREKYFNSIGEYFCQNEKKCAAQCKACNEYFENKLIKEVAKVKQK